MGSGPACAPTLLLFPLEEAFLEGAPGSQLLAVVACGAGCLSHGAKLLVAAEDCSGWRGDGHGHPQLPVPSASPGAMQGPPSPPCLPWHKDGTGCCCALPASNAIPAALQRGGQGAGKCEKEANFLHWQEVTVSFVHGKASALPTVKKLWSYLF